MVISGTSGNDTLVGTADNDEISGLGGDDLLDGQDGVNTLLGGEGNDTLVVSGGSGSGSVFSLSGSTATGGSGSDVYEVAFSTTSRSFTITDFSGEDVLDLAAIVAASSGLSAFANPFDPALGYARIVSGSSALGGQTTQLQWDPDGAAGPSGWTVQLSLPGIVAIGPDDILLGPGASIDVILTATVTGGTIGGTSGAGGGGGGGGATIVQTVTAAVDFSLLHLPGSVSAGTASSAPALNHLVLIGDAVVGTGNDLANSITGNAAGNVLVGNAGNDTLTGGAGDDSLQGGAGQDVLRGSADSDTLRGGADNDDIRGGSDGDELYGGSSEDFLAGALGSDFLRGALGNDTLGGGQGNDTLGGGQGHDELRGGLGNDDLTGGLGADTFVFAGAGAPDADLVHGFSAAEGDVIQLDAGFFAGASFGTTLVYAAGGILYNGQLVATLEGAPILDAGDIVLG